MKSKSCKFTLHDLDFIDNTTKGHNAQFFHCLRKYKKLKPIKSYIKVELIQQSIKQPPLDI